MKELTEYNMPEELKEMTDDELELLAVQIREYLIETISKTGGHLASNLGIVELTIALHSIFDSPRDKIVWDVGHQSYVHKILTGRAKDLPTLRSKEGLSGFPKRSESEHDSFDTGHASTSLSVAEGLAEARDLKGEKNEVISVIGDGSMTGGMAYEALNNIGSSKSKVIVVLNDNGMSISKNIGGMSEHLAKLRTSKEYAKTKSGIKKILSRIPVIGKGVAGGLSGAKDILKYALLQGGVFFEALGFTYIGPVDGHNIEKLKEALENAKSAKRPVLVHVITKKGKGYRNAEDNPNKFHGIASFDPVTGTVKEHASKSFSNVMGEEIVKMADQNDNICAITAAMGTATGLSDFSNKYPKRFFDVGIAEEHAVTFAAGLAVGGMKPIVCIYSSFLQRAYDQIMEDVALEKANVVFAVDRAGIVGQDGETHQGIFDIAYFSTVPGMTLFAPSDGKELREMMHSAFEMDGPVAMRYPRGSCEEDEVTDERYKGTGRRISEGKDVDILTVGSMLDTALEARAILSGYGIDSGIFKVGRVLPIDPSVVCQGKLTVTLEDGVVSGGYGEGLRAACSDDVKMINIGWPLGFIEHGSKDDLYGSYGLDGKGIAERIRAEFERENR